MGSVTRLDDTLRTASLEAAGPDIVSEDFGGEMVVLNLANGRYFSLPGIAAAIWRDLADGCPVAALVAQAAGTVVRDGIETLAAGLVAEGLLRPRSTPVTTTPKSSFDGIDAVPAMEAYDDMAELILADPIHDVDEQVGWPLKRDDGTGG